MTFEPDLGLPALGRLLVYRPDSDLVPGDAEALGLPDGAAVLVRLAVPLGARVVTRERTVLAIALREALPALLASEAPQSSGWRRRPDTLRVFALTARLGVSLVATHHLAPMLVASAEGAVHGTWRALPATDAASRVVLDRLAAALPPAGHALLHSERAVWAPDALLGAFLDAIADICARDAAPPARPGRPRERLLPWTARWAEALGDLGDPRVPLREEAPELLAGVSGWHEPAVDADVGLTEVRLTTPPPDGDRWRLDLGLRLHGAGFVPAADVWRGAQLPDAPDAAAQQEALLRGLGRCARVFAPLDAALRQAAPEGIGLTLREAWDFIREAAPLLDGSDVIVVLPDDLVDEPPRVRVRLDDAFAAESNDETRAAGHLRAAWAGEGSAMVRWEVALGDETLTDAELDVLLAADAPLVRWGERWVRVAPDVRDRMAGLSDGRIPLAEALLLGLAGSAPAGALPGADPESTEPVEVVTDGRIAALVARLRDTADPPPLAAEPEGFVGELRPYQRRGVAWLGGMSRLGLGAVLADDMGLGKTIQLIGHVLERGQSGPHLVVCPTSVVGNWERELRRFAPDVPVTRFHGPERAASLEGVKGVVVTSYGVVRRDADPLVAIDWDVVALDEAQHVKNPTTAGAKAVRLLRAEQVVALTGTPLENRLAELWSLLDVTNPGLLGSRGRFGRRYVAPIERRRDPGAATRLRRVVAPFVLRREKRDPDIVADLPDKIERTVACALTPEQARLYERAVEAVLGGQGLTGITAMQRRGRVLALLTALKQVCNHPAHYLREAEGGPVDPATLPGRSGKLAAAREIVAEATGNGDQVLVFTQFVQMGNLLVAQLAADLDTEVPFLHGGVSATGRDAMVAAFQGEGSGDVPPVFVVSLRAGGTGLNLTAANHVLHYDRWWNPAVEDQATDRAHRIGQSRTVEVHKLVTAGTVEERIADLLERKRSLAESIVGAGEQWVTELGEAELRELVALSSAGEELDDEDFADSWDREAFQEADS